MGDNIMRESFNVSSPSDRQRFQQFIGDLRGMLRAADRPFVMQDAVRLPPQENDPSRWLDLELRGTERAITLRLRADNLYVVGFRNGEGRWFELAHNDGHGNMIQEEGVTPLNVHEGYTGGEDGNTLQLNEGVQVAREAIETAIDQLAVYDGTAPDSKLKVWLLSLIVGFVESIRLNTVADYIARLMIADETEGQFPWSLVGQIKKWSSLCTLLLQVANDVVQDPAVLARRFEPYARIGIHNAFELATTLGMVLVGNAGRRRRRRSVDDDDNADHAVAGVTLVEVIEVVVRNIDGEDPGDLYGEIAVTDGFGLQLVFDRDRSDTQSVSPGGGARLTGPGRAVSGDDGFTIKFDLKDRDLDPSPDDEVSKEEVAWSPLDATGDEYDVVRSRTIAGKNGAVELRYAVMADAAAATVEVVLLDSSESVPDVYGSVATTTSLENGEAVTIKLFDRDNTERASVERGSAVPLLRKAVAVPLGSVLQVAVGLWDRNLVLADEQIASGSVTFQPRLAGEDSQEVSGDNGRVAVRVAWSTWFE
ncbi:hypothetical protein ACP4OV_002357 [Aristida adscensionis]